MSPVSVYHMCRIEGWELRREIGTRDEDLREVIYHKGNGGVNL